MLILLVLVALTLLILLLRFLTKYVKVCGKVATVLKERLFYNAFLRFILQGTLKLQIGAGAILVLEDGDYDRVSLTTAFLILFVFQTFPLLFYCIMKRKRDQLHLKETKSKIGSIYLGLNTEKDSVMSYSPVFLIRRSIFVFLTFKLFDMPNPQLLAMVFWNISYMGYISNVRVHEWTW